MFSMRYTSPKVTPKKDVPSSLDVAIHNQQQQHGERAQDNNSGDDANRNSLLNDVVPTQTLLQPKLLDNEEDLPEETSSKKQVSPTLTKDNIISSNGNQIKYLTSVNNNNNNNNSSISEIDSEVVNISDDIEPRPRSNLLALLDREYNNNNANSNYAGSAAGGEQEQYGVKDKVGVIKINESSNNNLAANENIDDDKTSAIDNNCIEEKGKHTNVSSDDRVIEDDVDVDFDSDFSSDHRKDTIRTTSINNLHENNSFHVQQQQVRESSSFGFNRSTSMEPMGLVGRSRSADEGVIDQQTSSVDGVVDDDDDDDGDDAQPEGTSTKQQSSSRIVYDMSKEYPASPILSAINGGDESTPIGSPASAANTTSEIGGDTYFERKTTTTNPAQPCLDEKQQQGGESFDDDLVHVTLPPRVNRTTLTGYSNSGSSAPFLSNCSSPARDPMLPSHPLSPRQAFTHTHSLLDDCSDEEEEMTSFTIEDSPTRHAQQSSYSCLPRARNSSEGSPFSYFKKQQKQNKNLRQTTSSSSTGSSATLVASNNIQQALLKTRHRRWECQMEFAGPHAQSKEVFDLSNRVHYIVGYSPENNYSERGQVARLSVSVEAIRAAALASGLWRTVRLVKLPKGLFFSNFDQMLEYDSVEEEEIWALLKMLNSTFPMLDQLDFGGDISRGPFNRNSDDDDVANNTCDNDEWRNEIISCIMECLPNLLAIDGFVVEQEVHRTESHGEYVVPIGSEEAESSLDNTNHSQNQNNLQKPTEKNLIGIRIGKDSDAVDALGDTTTSPSQNTLKSSHPNGSMMDVVETKKVSPGTLSTSSSLLSSSKSWGSTNSSSSRPPTCPASATKPRPRLPTKPVDRKKSLMKAGSGLKRRVMGLIPSVSMMDNAEEDEDEDEDESEDSENEAETDCPRDLL